MLTPEQLDFYHENGYHIIDALLTQAEADMYRRECHELAQRFRAGEKIDATWGSAREAVPAARDTEVLHCHNVQFYSAVFSRLIVDERFTAVAADIIGSSNVQLHHTKMFIKPPEKGSPFPLHQDFPYFPHARNTMIAAVFHFDDAPIEKGCIRVIPKSHKLGPLEHNPEGGWHRCLAV